MMDIAILTVHCTIIGKAAFTCNITNCGTFASKAVPIILYHQETKLEHIEVRTYYVIWLHLLFSNNNNISCAFVLK